MPPQERATKATGDPVRTQFLEMTIGHLMEAEANFLGVYDVLLGMVKNTEATDKMTEFRGDHERHVEDLKDALDQLGGREIVPDRNPSPLGEAVVRELRGIEDERELLTRFLVNETFSESVYGAALHLDVPEPVVRAVSRAHEDEQRHREWAETFVGNL